MKSRTGWVVVLLVGMALALAIWIAIAEHPGDAVAARHAAPSPPPAELPTVPAPSAERVEADDGPAASESSAPSPVSVAPLKDAATSRRSVWLAVMNHDIAPVIGAQVAVSERMDPGPDDRKLVGATDVAGRIELVLEGANEKYVRAFTLNHASSGWARLSKLELDAQQARVLRVEPMAHVVGLVLRDDGVPVRRARVALDVVGQMFGRPFAEHPPQLATDDKGRFESYVEAFGSSFRATASVGDQIGQPHEFRPENGQEVELTLHVGDELSVSGVVSAPDRSVAANATVVVRSDPSAIDDRNALAKEIKCDAQGRFRFPLPHMGRFEACASGESWASSNNMAFDVTAEKPSAEIALVLVQGVTIEGRVVRDDGAPLANVKVGAHHDECSNCKRADHAASGSLGRLSATTDADGHFVLAPARVDPHLYTLGCGPDPKRPKAWLELRDVAAGRRDVEFVVNEAALVDSVFEGRVKLEGTGAPLTILRIEVYRRRERYWEVARSETVESADGRFRIESLHAGIEYGAMISNIAGYMPVVVEPWTASGASNVVELTMPKPRTLDVTVTDERGVGIAGAVVQFSVERKYPGYDGFLFNTTKGDGFARMNFWPGSFLITASVKNRRSESLPVVIADRNTPLTLVVPSK